MNTTVLIILAVVFCLAPIIVSYVVEELRPKPVAPEKLSWAPEIPIKYIEVKGNKLRYITAGTGQPLVLLHTLRTQLDIFQKVLPELSKHFKIYAFDYPGHGWSDIPGIPLKPDVFIEAAADFLEALDIKDAVVAGISIGGTIPLVLASRHNKRIKKVISINPYDYGSGGGLQRSSGIANLIFSLSKIPIMGETVMRMRNLMIEKKIFEGGVFTPDALPKALLEELYKTGCRPGHYKAFLSLIRNAAAWDKARQEYRNINIPVLLIYGEKDWSNEAERKANQRGIPGVKTEIVSNASHFMSLDAPNQVSRLILEFASS
ncbi:MAG: alpha/beta hydrolase [Gammaproteobacteria bacterium]|nr:alpha/beta hydrolase [Gammaproteobacteria bacterium]